MSDLKLFRVAAKTVTELPGQSAAVEKSLQELIERSLDSFFGIRFLATEYSTGPVHGGRIDTLGIDENGCPVIIEYKRALNENVINQGLFYLDWLLDHKGEFKLLVMEKFGKNASDSIEWSTPRLLCVAGDFTKYDGHAIQQINRNIELIRYRRYGEDLLLFELVNATTAQPASPEEETSPRTRRRRQATGPRRQVTESLTVASKEVRDRFEALRSFLHALGDDVQMKTLKYYFAFKRIKNCACVEIHRQSGEITVFVHVDPDTVKLKEGFTRDMRNTGHYGTGELEITIRSDEDLKAAEPLLVRSYEAS